MSNRLQNQIAIVTGSSSGNGRAIALALAGAGANIVCADLEKKARKEGYEKDLDIDTDDVIRKQGSKACYIHADVRDATQIENLVARTVSDFGRLDIMINNAGVLTGSHTIVDETEEQYDFTMSVNTKGVWLSCKYAVIQMLKQDPLATGSRGKIVNIASVAGLCGCGSLPAYCASKGAVVNLTRQLAVDFARQRINVNAVCPGLIPTALSRGTTLQSEEWLTAVPSWQPWPRLGTPKDVAQCVLFLSSPEAEWITGSMLTVDGGSMAS
jgi:NAD(P)-dependent dehydrogenase (short-subunit alcohol dehydrogenase family)